MLLLPLAAALTGAAFAALVLRDYAVRRRPYQLVWGAALAMFAIAALFETQGVAAGWSVATYKGYYLFGGLLNVGWLGVGTLYLLAPRRVAEIGAALMAGYTVMAVLAVAVAHVSQPALATTFPTRASDVPVILPIISNLAGTVLLVGGAGWSALAVFARRGAPSRVVGTALIAAGALVVGADHSLAQASGVIALQPVSEALGIAIMLAGYLAVERKAAGRRTAVQ